MCSQWTNRKKKEDRRKNIFQDIELQIMLTNEQIKNHQRSIEKAKKISGWYCPAGLGGFDYSKGPGGNVHISFAEGLQMIEQDTERIRKLKEKRTELKKSMKRIKKIYESLDGNEGQVYYLRVICGMTQEEAANEMGFSKRHLQRIESGMRDRGLL